MIKEVTGDILLSKAPLIAHGVAPNDDFKQGLALSLRERFPAMYKDFRHYCKVNHPKPGRMWVWGGVAEGGRGLRIANLFTQEPPRHQADKPGVAHVEFVNHALHDLRHLIEQDKVETIALPRLATGVGKLDWANVRPLIERQLGDLDCRVIIYTTFKAGQEADEA